ncbi:MAG: RNA polymerase sigma factor [Dehalococcoidia bacterium]
MDDQDAMTCLRQGDISGLESLVARHQAEALKAAYLITRDRGLSEDIVQAVFMRVYERAAQFDPARPFRPWFLRAVTNDALKAVSRKARSRSLDERLSPGVSLADLVPDTAPSLPEQAEQSELHEAITRAVAQLSPAQRAAVVQRYYLGLKESEMAEQGGQTPGTIKQLLHRARERLRVQLRPAVVDEESDVLETRSVV